MTTRARVSLSEATITKISSGETIIIRVGELVEIEVTQKVTPGASEIHPNPKTGKELLESILGKGGEALDGLLDGIFCKNPLSKRIFRPLSRGNHGLLRD
jgi:hypothetical protein